MQIICVRPKICGNEDPEIHQKLTRPDQKTLAILESERVNLGEAITVSEILRVKNCDFYNYQRANLKDTSRLDADCLKSLDTYGEITRQPGGLTLREEMGM